MKHITLTLFAFSVVVAPAAVSQTITNEGTSSTSHLQASPSSYFFPHN